MPKRPDDEPKANEEKNEHGNARLDRRLDTVAFTRIIQSFDGNDSSIDLDPELEAEIAANTASKSQAQELSFNPDDYDPAKKTPVSEIKEGDFLPLFGVITEEPTDSGICKNFSYTSDDVTGALLMRKDDEVMVCHRKKPAAATE
jgi:hypothetical protein